MLRSGLVHGYMVVTKGLSEAAVDGRLPATSGLRTVELAPDLQPRLELLVGVFTRRGERAAYAADHPLNLLIAALVSTSVEWQHRS